MESLLKPVSVWIYGHYEFSVVRHHQSPQTGAKTAVALCSFIVTIEAVSAIGEASKVEASVAADFELRERSSIDAFGLWFRVSK
ncbi:uncharacterized protein DS421_4g131640 [Arachis hypogaea]|nr:uncharacterized protein DS421_4g131640 [Arachis hypogaea]